MICLAKWPLCLGVASLSLVITVFHFLMHPFSPPSSVFPCNAGARQRNISSNIWCCLVSPQVLVCLMSSMCVSTLSELPISEKNLIRPSLQQTRVLSGKYSHMLIPQSTPCGKTHQNTHGKVTDLAWSSESVRTRWRMDWELTKSDQNQSEQKVGLELLSSFLLLPCQAAAYIVENQDCDV